MPEMKQMREMIISSHITHCASKASMTLNVDKLAEVFVQNVISHRFLFSFMNFNFCVPFVDIASSGNC